MLTTPRFDAHMPYARCTAASVAKKTGIPYEDAEADALIALWKADRDFDPSRGIKFKTYLSFKIHKTIIDGLRLVIGKKGTPAYEHRIRPAPIHRMPIALNVVSREDNPSHAEEMRDEVRHVLRGIPDRDRTILTLYSESVPFAEIGNRIGLSESRISQIVSETIAHLRERECA